MSFPIPFLDCLILAAASYPSGFSHSVFTAFAGRPRGVTAAFLCALVLPYLGMALALGWIRPELLRIAPAGAGLIVAALLAAPVALALEAGIHALFRLGTTGRLPRGIELPRLWRVRLGLTGHLLLVLIVLGEELLYRQLWIGLLQGSLGLGAPAALAISSLAYGVNHLAFGGLSVLSKAASGLVYGGLFLAAGGSLWPALVAHGVQNLLLLELARRRHG
jgi:membrane protease YdiL (CAAX protease family)